MSNYESFNGKGKVTTADFAKLRKILVEAYNKDLERIDAKVLKKEGYKKANSRTLSFPIVRFITQETWVRGKEKSETFADELGAIVLNKEDKTFRFYVHENNHAVDDAFETKVLQELKGFMNDMPKKGKIYGAETAYKSEYNEDEYGNTTPSYSHYGGWV